MKKNYIFLKNIEKNRKRNNVYKKICYSKILHDLYNFKITEIAKMFNVKHSIIIYYIKSFNNYIIYDDFSYIYQKSINELEKELKIENENNNEYSKLSISEKVEYILKKHRKAVKNDNYLIKKYFEYELLLNSKFSYKNFYFKFDKLCNIDLILIEKQKIINK